MSALKREITRADIMPMADYADVRKQRRAEASAIKKKRRVEVGPFATLYFESYDTMWIQIHEMLHIEKGGEAQVEGELAAYNPLVPKGRELVATLMFEIPDPERRGRELRRLGGVEGTVTLKVGQETITAVPEDDVERTRSDGKASSVHFLHFPFSDAQVARFRDPAVEVLVGINHPNYGHAAVLPAEAREALAGDFE
ncbi:MAG: DUF3501 family protein [Proteobacteria bacterium]|nr:DUF3501 family protein [Pseudomonadota bacterium]